MRRRELLGATGALLATSMADSLAASRAKGANAGRRPNSTGCASLMPALRDASHVQERTLFWRYHAHSQGAVRRGQYKYLRIENSEFLFDIVADPQERGNLSKRQEAVFRELKDAWTKWDASMLPYTQQNAAWSNKQNLLPERY